MTGVLENYCFRIVLMYRFLYPVKIVAIYLFAKSFNIFKIIVIKAGSRHIRTALFTAAHRFSDDIKKDFARIIVYHDLFNLGNELIKISRVETHQMVACPAEIGIFTNIRWVYSHPIVMLNRILFIKACRNIYRSTNSDFLACFKLCLEQIKFQRRIHCVYLCRVI